MSISNIKGWRDDVDVRIAELEAVIVIKNNK
jgi:hypothetical protein